jgi:hypothetical protein
VCSPSRRKKLNLSCSSNCVTRSSIRIQMPHEFWVAFEMTKGLWWPRRIGPVRVQSVSAASDQHITRIIGKDGWANRIYRPDQNTITQGLACLFLNVEDYLRSSIRISCEISIRCALLTWHRPQVPVFGWTKIRSHRTLVFNKLAFDRHSGVFGHCCERPSIFICSGVLFSFLPSARCFCPTPRVKRIARMDGVEEEELR